MRLEAQFPSELTLWCGPYSAIYRGGNTVCSNTLARVSPPLASDWSGVDWSAMEWRSQDTGFRWSSISSDLQARVPHDTGMSCLLHSAGFVLL